RRWAARAPPPFFPPPADVMAPLSSTSAALAGMAKVDNPAATTAARLARDRYFACVSFIRLLLGITSSRRRLRRRHGLEVRHNGIDLCGLEDELESRHAWRPVRDGLAHHVLAAAGGFLRQRRSECVGGDLRLEVAHPARLSEACLPHALLLIEPTLGSGPGRQRKKQ